MKEYDLFSSIGELDEKLLRRYGQEPTPTPQRRRWIRQLLTHAILLLLILGLIAWLLFCRRPAEPERIPRIKRRILQKPALPKLLQRAARVLSSAKTGLSSPPTGRNMCSWPVKESSIISVS